MLTKLAVVKTECWCSSSALLSLWSDLGISGIKFLLFICYTWYLTLELTKWWTVVIFWATSSWRVLGLTVVAVVASHVVAGKFAT